MTTIEAIEQAMKTVNAQYGTNMKLKPMAKYVEEGCIKRASIARRKANKQSNSKCGLAVKNSLEAHADAIDKFYSSGNKVD